MNSAPVIGIYDTKLGVVRHDGRSHDLAAMLQSEIETVLPDQFAVHCDGQRLTLDECLVRDELVKFLHVSDYREGAATIVELMQAIQTRRPNPHTHVYLTSTSGVKGTLPPDTRTGEIRGVELPLRDRKDYERLNWRRALATWKQSLEAWEPSVPGSAPPAFPLDELFRPVSEFDRAGELHVARQLRRLALLMQSFQASGLAASGTPGAAAVGDFVDWLLRDLPSHAASSRARLVTLGLDWLVESPFDSWSQKHRLLGRCPALGTLCREIGTILRKRTEYDEPDDRTDLSWSELFTQAQREVRFLWNQGGAIELEEARSVLNHTHFKNAFLNKLANARRELPFEERAKTLSKALDFLRAAAPNGDARRAWEVVMQSRDHWLRVREQIEQFFQQGIGQHGFALTGNGQLLKSRIVDEALATISQFLAGFEPLATASPAERAEVLQAFLDACDSVGNGLHEMALGDDVGQPYGGYLEPAQALT